MSVRVLVTGAGGFVGRVLVQRLLGQGLNGRRVDEVVVADLSLEALPRDDRIQAVHGSLADAAVLDAALAGPVQAVFHLASVPGGAAERDPLLARRVNLDATMNLLERLHRQGDRPHFVFASTVAVYGENLSEVVSEHTPPRPVLSYGAHKLCAEIMVADAHSRGWVRACSLRLPGVVARPGEGEGLMSAFMSRLFWKLKANETITLPVSAEGTAWWISVGACVDNLLHGTSIDPDAMAADCVVQMPALWLSMQQVIDAAVEVYGPDRRQQVSFAPQPLVQRLFASLPPLATHHAQALGFTHDGNALGLVLAATADNLGKR